MRLKRWTLAIVFLALGSSPLVAQAKKVRVVCTLPTLRALTEEIGGDRVDVIALAKGDQDPHFVTPTPVLMRKTREADLFIDWGDQETYSLKLGRGECAA